MKRLALAVLLLASPAFAPAALAQDRPPLLPTRDVDVTYRSTRGDQALEQRSRFGVAQQRLRLDMPTPGLFMIVDYAAKTMSLVSEGDRKVLDLSAPPGMLPGQANTAGATLQGADTVAGLPCTEWQTADTQGVAALLCLTADGVMLRARHGTQVLAIATRVAFGPIDRAVFEVPAGFEHVKGRTPP